MSRRNQYTVVIPLGKNGDDCLLLTPKDVDNLKFIAKTKVLSLRKYVSVILKEYLENSYPLIGNDVKK